MNLSLKNKFNRSTYALSKKILFSFEPETMHNTFTKIGKVLGSSKITKKSLSLIFNYQDHSLEQKIKGIYFKNPVGLSAGFDKNAELIETMDSIGFGFVEVGSITAKPCKGNTGKRLARLPEKESIWVNLGLNNEGALKIHEKLKNKKYSIPVGISIAKTNCKETADPEEGLKDYISSLKILKKIGDYITINISCPNAYGGQPFSNPSLYEKLLKETKKLKIKKPILVKLSPDISKENIDKILKISKKYKISGFICTNLTKKGKSGGFSGKLVEKKANSLLSYVYKKTKNENYILVGSGGVSSAEDAYKKIKLGANLVQLITGMIYHGPSLIGEINQGLVQLLKKDNYSNISQAVGKNAEK
ncbi:MAG: quinone-dependent dihydroorotate dehydrogenase [Nanoarchaeota archaeon]